MGSHHKDIQSSTINKKHRFYVKKKNQLFQTFSKSTMDAKIFFDLILTQVETSPLNFGVSKTPFSAMISLKSSFAKRFDKSRNENLSQK